MLIILELVQILRIAALNDAAYEWYLAFVLKELFSSKFVLKQDSA